MKEVWQKRTLPFNVFLDFIQITSDGQDIVVNDDSMPHLQLFIKFLQTK